jgi:hypothetical protein
MSGASAVIKQVWDNAGVVGGEGIVEENEKEVGMEKEGRQEQRTSGLQVIVDTKLPKDHVRGQFSSPLPSHLCSLISMTYDPQNKIELTNIINVPKIGTLHCPTNLAQIPVYREASLIR